DLDPVPAEVVAVLEAGSREEPRFPRRAGDHVAPLALPVVAPVVLNADEPGLGPAELAPELDFAQPVATEHDLGEEVVRREEGEVAAEVAVALDAVVRVPSDVLLVPGEDDEVVARGQLVPASELLEVVVRQEVDALLRPVQPGDERQVPVAEAVGNAEVEERTPQVDAPDRGAHVPAVAPAVAVCILEVVRLPGVRREHDGDTRTARWACSQDEGRVADAAVVRGRAKEVEPARPGADADDPQLGWRAVAA